MNNVMELRRHRHGATLLTVSTETYNLVSATISALTLISLLLYTLYTYRLLLATRAGAASTQSELEVMEKQLAVARDSFEFTRKELEIMQEQAKTAQAEIQLQQEKELRAARPIFVWRGGGNPNQQMKWSEFQNQGAPIAILETRAVNCTFTLTPPNFIPREATGRFSLTSFPPTGVVYIGIRYITTAGEIQSVAFRIEQGSISPRIDHAMIFDSMAPMPPPSQPVDFIL